MTKMRASASYLAAILVVGLTLHACGGGEDGPPPVRVDVQPPVLGVQRVFPNLTFVQPVAMLQAPGDPTRWFVVEQAGQVLVFNNNPAVTTATPFLNINDGRVDGGGEMGLLGMAFHPNFPADPRVYVHYTNTDSGRVSRISEFKSTNGGVSLNANPEQILLVINQPEANHNGGHLAFGQDRFLYIGMGDGGGGNDQGPPGNSHGPIGNGQNMGTLLGKMLRIDVSPTTGYLIPGGHPFPATNPKCDLNGTSTLECPEIYASGFRNPWRWSFDRQTGELWVGDVGQGRFEEIDRVTVGGNYGWVCFEGSFFTGLPCGMEPNLQPPVAEYGRTVGTTVTGGYVYRGTVMPGLVGRYVFGDFGSGRIWHIAGDTQPTITVSSGFDTGLNISSFGEGADGELYMVHYGGQLYRLTGS